MFTRMQYILIISVVAALSWAACGSNKTVKIVIKGSTTVLPIAQKASEAFMDLNEDIDILLSGTGSGDGIRCIIEGSCDIANSSRTMKDKEIDDAKTAGKSIKEIVLAYDMICPIVHPSNMVRDLTIDQLRGIFSGDIKNWRDVGGAEGEIIVVSRDTSSGTYEYWMETVIKKDKKLTPEAVIQASNGAVANFVSENVNAIGYVGHGYLNNAVKPLSVNGIEPSIENGKNGLFPIFRELYMYVDAYKQSKATKNYIDFLLGVEGQKAVSDAGFIPL